MATIKLDICTPEGKTWLARVVGVGGEFGVNRQFVNARKRDTSRSGMTGVATYIVGDGIYESNEGRRRLGRRWWRVTGDDVQEIDEDEAIAAVIEATTVVKEE